MTNPVLWGPAVWQALFSCAWHCNQAQLQDLLALLLHQVPLLLPCDKCRKHYLEHKPIVNRRAHGEPKSAEHAFKWLWYLKDEINKTLRRPSTSLHDITERHLLHGGVVDDVLLGDSLVLVALQAHDLQRDDLFIAHCHTLAKLLPLPDDSELKRSLTELRKPIVIGAVRSAKAARVERGLPELKLSHYKAIAVDGEKSVAAV